MTTKQDFKERGIRIGIHQLVTYATLVPIFWFVAQPILVEALADDIQKSVAAQVEPIKNGFVALLQQEINGTKRDIAALEFRQRQGADWTAIDDARLTELRIQLDALEDAKADLQKKIA